MLRTAVFTAIVVSFLAGSANAEFEFDLERGLVISEATGKPVPDLKVGDDRLVRHVETGQIVPAAELAFPVATRLDLQQPVPGQSNTNVSGNFGNLKLMPIGDSIPSGAGVSDRTRPGYRPYLWQNILDPTNGVALMNDGFAPTDTNCGSLATPTIGLDMRGQFDQPASSTGRVGWGTTDGATGENPVKDQAWINLPQQTPPANINTHRPAGNVPYMPCFDDDNQAGRGLESGNFLQSGAGKFDQTPDPTQGNAPAWIANQDPDIVTITLGTNNIINGGPVGSDNWDRIKSIIDALELSNPDVCVYVSAIPPGWQNNGTAQAPNWAVRFPMATVQTLNDEIEAGINALGASYDVKFVDIMDDANAYSTGTNNPWHPASSTKLIDGGTSGTDGIHPSIAGDKFIADKFYAVMKPDLITKAAAAVPEPSPFLFFAMFSMVLGGQKYFIRRRQVAG